MTRTGGCACGAVRFVATGEPWRVGVCHCMTCRKTHGAPMHAFAVFPRDRVTVSGTLTEWRSSGPLGRLFCPTCGSHVLRHEDPDEVEVMVGAFDEPDRFRPTYELWIGRRESWLPAVAPRQYAGNRQGPARTE